MKLHTKTVFFSLLASSTTFIERSFAQESSSASLSVSGDGAKATADTKEEGADGDRQSGSPDRTRVPYLKRYLPEHNLWEFGVFGGLMFPSKNHELHDENKEQRRFKTAGDLGVRIAYYPLSFLGAEFEMAAMPTAVSGGGGAGLYAARGHLIGQLPISSITPFLLIGGGALGGTSEVTGTDVDRSLHFGLGAKAALDEYVSLRFDVRDNLSQKDVVADGKLAHHPEVLLGVTFTLERRRPDADGDGFADHRDNCVHVSGAAQGCPADQDGDGIDDERDECRDVAGVAPSGCPDQDGDGVLDRDDSCPNLPAQTKTGCPAPDCGDRDGDGFSDDVDECPETPGKAPNGCENADEDGDGITDDLDKCPAAAETKNGYQDDDGCPDEVPAEIERFSGTIRGIEFEYNSDRITAASKPLLDEAAEVLKRYEDLKLEIVGHSDSQGSRELNMDLSRRRADSVKNYLVQQGVNEVRLHTRGAGPDEPIADNGTPEGRQKNRRIEFKRVNQ